jgi:hypothetical protein
MFALSVDLDWYCMIINFLFTDKLNPKMSACSPLVVSIVLKCWSCIWCHAFSGLPLKNVIEWLSTLVPKFKSNTYDIRRWAHLGFHFIRGVSSGDGERHGW